MAMTKSDTLNYRGELFAVGNAQTPFLNAISGRAKRSQALAYSMANTYAMAAGSQPAITEDAAAAAGTAATKTTAEEINTAQIFKSDVSVSFVKQAQIGQMSGINTDQPGMIVDPFTFQKQVQLKQMAIDMDYTFLNGTYAAASTTGTAAGTKGILTGITTNAVAASSATLTKDMVDSMLSLMYTNGAPFGSVILFVNAFQKRQIGKIYGYAPMDRTAGGLNIDTIYTDFGALVVVLDPNVPAGSILACDTSVTSPVFVPFQFNGTLGQSAGTGDANGVDVGFYNIGLVSAASSGFWFSMAGIDYGAEKYHGKITGLATA